MNISVNIGVLALSVTEKVELNLAAREVWQILHNFGGVEAWHPTVAKTQIIEGVNNTVGAVRKLTFLNGGTLEEQLMAYTPDQMRLEYKLTRGEFPVSRYSSILSVRASDDGVKSIVTWEGSFSRADLSADPIVEKNDKAAIDAVTSVYVTGLKSLEDKVIDTLAIKQVIDNYREGGTEGKPEIVAKAFHPSATMKFIKDGTLVDVPIAVYLTDYIKPGLKSDRTVYTDYLDIKGTSASARLTIDYATHQFVDYFNLLKINGQWLIVSKIFHRVTK